MHRTKYIQQITDQLNKMSEEQKNQWILSQAKLCNESQRQGFLQSLTGEKKVPYMPVQREIDEFCRKVEEEEIYVEYETHYYEFDDDGKYMDDWKSWHNDPFGAMPVLDSILMGCHDLLILGEYGMAADILDRVCRLKFKVVEAVDSDEYADVDDRPFTLAGACKEGRLSRELPEIGLDWVRASIGRANEMGDSAPVGEVIDILENPVCKNVHPHMLPDDELLEGIFSDELLVQMEKILAGEIQKGEEIFQETYAEVRYSHEKVRFRKAIIRKKEILLNIQLKCRKEIPGQREDMSFDCQWKRINEVYALLPYEYGEYGYGIRNRWEVDEIQKMCASLLRRDNLGAEDWELRKAVLSDLVTHRFYKKVNCEQMMSELSERLCGRKEEFLAFADMLNQSGEYEYKKEAASLYHQYGKEIYSISGSAFGEGRKDLCGIGGLLSETGKYRRRKENCQTGFGSMQG